MNSNHAPGPWQLSGKTVSHIWKTRRYAVATVNGKLFTPECTAANARILAAAPELLDALRGLLEHYWTGRGPRNVKKHYSEMVAVAAALAAIRKSTGS